MQGQDFARPAGFDARARPTRTAKTRRGLRARQDSNLRPTAPEQARRSWVRVARVRNELKVLGLGQAAESGRHRDLRGLALRLLHQCCSSRQSTKWYRRGVEQLLTVAEVAERLRVSTATVYALCKRGQLRHVRVANAIRISDQSVADFLGRSL
jgi:excisionase family DNA binding protein